MLRRKLKQARESIIMNLQFVYALAVGWIFLVLVMVFFGSILLVVLRILAFIFGLSWGQ